MRQGRYTSVSAFSCLFAGFSRKDKIVGPWWVCSFLLETLRCGSQACVGRHYTAKKETIPVFRTRNHIKGQSRIAHGWSRAGGRK